MGGFRSAHKLRIRVSSSFTATPHMKHCGGGGGKQTAGRAETVPADRVNLKSRAGGAYNRPQSYVSLIALTV